MFETRSSKHHQESRAAFIREHHVAPFFQIKYTSRFSPRPTPLFNTNAKHFAFPFLSFLLSLSFQVQLFHLHHYSPTDVEYHQLSASQYKFRGPKQASSSISIWLRLGFPGDPVLCDELNVGKAYEGEPRCEILYRRFQCWKPSQTSWSESRLWDRIRKMSWKNDCNWNWLNVEIQTHKQSKSW